MRTAHVWFANNCPVAGNTAMACNSPDAGPNLVGTLIWYTLPDGSIQVADNANQLDANIKPDIINGAFTITLPYLGPLSTKASDLGKVVIETKPDQNGFDLYNFNNALLVN
jgi:hypothetical protein